MLKKVDGLKPIAEELGVPLSQLAIAWCAANPNVSSVICGATKESQVSCLRYWIYLPLRRRVIAYLLLKCLLHCGEKISCLRRLFCSDINAHDPGLFFFTSVHLDF